MGRYIPGNVPEPMASELSKVANALDTGDAQLNLDMLYAAPKKFREGTIVLADGTRWNPGSGGGFYGYRAGAWRFLG